MSEPLLVVYMCLNLVISGGIADSAIPPPPQMRAISFSGPSFTVSWSPPSDSGGVGGYLYMFGVTGEGCGCVNMSVSEDTTSVTCSGWTAVGQTCSFEVRTLSQDCGLSSDPVTENITLKECDPNALGGSPTSTVRAGSVMVSNGVINYTDLTPGSVATLVCDSGYRPQSSVIYRTCGADGHWSDGELSCREEVQPPQGGGCGTTCIIAVVVFGATLPLLIVCVIIALCLCLSGKELNYATVSVSTATAKGETNQLVEVEKLSSDLGLKWPQMGN